MADPVDRLTIEDGISGPMKAAEAQLNRTADAADNVEKTVTRVGTSAQTLVRRFDDATRLTAALEKAQRNLASAQDTLAAGVAAGTVTQEQANAVLNTLSAKAAAARSAIDSMKTSTEGAATASTALIGRINAQAVAVEAAANAQSAYNKALGVSQSAGPDSYASRAADIAAYGAELDRLRAKFNPVFAASKQYEATLTEISEAERLGAVTATEAAAARERVTSAFAAANQPLQRVAQTTAAVASSTGQAEFAARQFTVQFSQLASGIATGQPVFQALIQQGHQVGDVMLSTGTGFKGLGSAVLGMLGPLGTLPGLLSVGVVAGLGAAGYAAESASRDMLALQTSLRATRDDFAAMATEAENAARAVASSSGFSTADARSAATAFARQPSFQGTQAQLQNLVRAAGDLATVLGVSLPTAAEELAKAISDPASVAEELAKQFGGTIPQATIETIKQFAAAGDTARAFGVIMGVVQDKTHGAAEASKSELQKALTELGNAFSTTDGQGKSFATTLGDTITHAAAQAVRALAEVVRNIEGLWEAATRGGHVGALPGASAGSVNPVVVSPDSRLPTGVSNEIYRIAEARNYAGSADVSALQADFATRLAYQESGGNQFAKGGGVLTSSAGALGVMQVLPGTGAGFDLTTTSGNIDAGLKYIATLWTKYGGNPGLVAMAYNWGPARVDDLLAGVKTIKDIPAETQNYVQNVTGQSAATFLPGGANVSTGALPGTAYGPPVPSTLNTGVVNLPGQIVNEALQRANGAGTATGAATQALNDIKLYQSALGELAKSGDTSSESVHKLNQALQASQLALYNAIGPADKLVRSLDTQIAGENAVAIGWANGAAAAEHATNAVKAQADALQFAAPGTRQYADIVAVLTAKYDELSASRQRVAAESALFDQGQQLAYLRLESSTLGESEDVRTRTLAVEKERQAIAKTMPGILDSEKQGLLDNAAAIADATSALQRQQNAINEIGNIVSNVAGQIESAISTAFVSGQGAAVNFGNITRAVLASTASEALKLAAINPLLNATVGGTRTTLSDVLGAAGAVGGSGAAGGSGGSGIFGLAGNLSTLYSAGKTAYGVITGDTPISLGALGDIPLFGSAAIPSLAGASAADIASATSASGLLSENALAGILGTGQATTAPLTLNSLLATHLFGTATVGGALAGVGAGFGVGSLAGGFVQGALGKVGPAPTIGAGLGAASGAAIGSFIPGIGTILGGIIGGLIGGGGGAFIGPKAPSPYSSTALGVAGGGLQIGDTLSQATDASGLVATLKQQVSDVNTFLQQIGVKIDGQSSYSQFGTNTPGGYVDPSKFENLYTPNVTGQTAFSKYAFSAPGNDRLNVFLQGRTFATLPDMEGFIRDFQAGQDALNQLLQTTAPQLEAVGKTTGAYNDQVKALTDQYGAAIDQAEALKSAVGIASDQVASLTQAETDLAAARDRATQTALDAVMKQGLQTNQDLTVRYYNAQANVTGNPADALNASLLSFDVQAQRQRDDLSAQIVATWGDSVKSTQAYVDEMALLERTLGEERLSIQQQYNNQITQSAATAVSGIADYASKLAVSPASALSPEAQYNYAENQFNSIAAAAARGDYTAITRLQSASDTLLSSSRVVNGSGSVYASDFSDVLAALRKVATITPDTLTATVLQTETRTQTAVLSDALDGIKAAVDSVRAQIAQSNSRPR